MLLRWLLLAGALVVVCGGAAVGAPRVAAPAVSRPPSTVALSSAGRRLLRVAPISLASDSLTRTAEKMTLRVRNISCSGVEVGSAWALDPHTLITNRHVLAGAAVLEADTWDGESLELNVGSAQTGRLVDIGVVKVAETLPQVASTGPAAKPGDKVTAVGYPLGGKLTLSPGRLVRYLDGRTLDPSIAFAGQVMQLTTKIKHGNSGGPVLDSSGRVVGVIYAGEPGATLQDPVRIAYAIPLSSARALLASGGTQAVTPCEQ